MKKRRPAKPKDRVHLVPWAAQDYLGSKARLYAIATGDTNLRVMYGDILNLLYEHGGRLPADPEQLAHFVHLPPPEVARCLPLLEMFGRVGRGGIVIEDGEVRNRRATETLREAKRYKAEQAAKVKAYWDKKKAEQEERRVAEASHRQATGKPIQEGGPYSSSVSSSFSSSSSKKKRKPPAAASSARAIPHDPTDPLQARIVARCVEDAARLASLNGQAATPQDAVDILAAVSATESGKSLDGLTGASQPWLEGTWRSFDAFERDHGIVDPEGDKG